MEQGLGEILAMEQFSRNPGCLSDRNVSKLPQMLSLWLCCLSPANDPQASLLVPLSIGIWSNLSPWSERFATFRLDALFACSFDGVFIVWPRLGASFSTPGPVTPSPHHFKVCCVCCSPPRWSCCWGEEIMNLTLVLSKIPFNESSFAIKNKFTEELHLSMWTHLAKVIRI